MRREVIVARATARYLVVISLCLGILALNSHTGAVTIKEVKSGESVVEYVDRVRGRFNQTLYQQVIGAANPYKAVSYTHLTLPTN